MEGEKGKARFVRRVNPHGVSLHDGNIIVERKSSDTLIKIHARLIKRYATIHTRTGFRVEIFKPGFIYYPVRKIPR